MSKEIDERVVSMQFDNRHFERNVQTTMSTLDKLKQKLHLPGAAKGLEEINNTAKRFDVSPLSRGLETVKLKFSALEVAGVTALANLTNSAVNAGKRIVSALTIDPVKTGFNEYELKMDSVKTIMASTGESIETVNKYLEELNEYSDQTIYSFSDMTQNIGKFTNAGVKLEDAVLAIKGISNEAALSGANANEASRAMYNFAQALSVGYIQRIDWKSIELANMATVGFKEELLKSAIAAGTVKKNAEGMYATLAHPEKAYNAAAMFTETLDDQWLTTEVLINTLKQYSDATTDIGKRAFDAAQDVTKLSQMFDILKETAQSGWAKTWEIMFGDLNQAKALFTPITEFFSKLINGMNDARNAVLKSALGKSFKSLLEPIKGIKKTVDTITEPIDKITKSLEDYNKVVKEVIRGDWGVTQKRWDALAEAGYDWATVQNMVNEELGSSVRHATNFSIGQAKTADATEKVTETNNAYIASLTKMSDAELKALDLTDEQINAIKQLKKEADKLGLSVEDFLANIDNLDGRWVVIQTFKNAGEALGKVFKTVAQAWKEIFPPKSVEERSNALYNIIAALHKFSLKLKMSDETADNLKRTLKGVFAIIDIITTITGGAFKVGIKVICKLLGALDVDILSVTASAGDAVVAFRDWLLNGNMLAKGLKKVIEVGKAVGGVIKKWISAFMELPAVQNGVKKLTDFLAQAFDMGEFTIAGLVNGLKSGIGSVVDVMISIGKKIISTIEKLLDIHSPSRVMFDIGKFIVEGLVNGIKSVISLVGDVTGHIVSTLMDVLGKIDTAKLASLGAMAAGFGSIYAAIKLVLGLAKMTNKLGDMFDNVGDVIGNFATVVKNFGGTLKAVTLNLKAKALKEIAIAVAILAGSVAVLSLLDAKKVKSAVGSIMMLTLMLAGLMVVMNKFGGTGNIKEAININGLTLALVGIGIAVVLLATAAKKIGSMNTDEIKQGFAGLTAIMVELGLLLVVFGKFTNGRQAKSIDKVGKLFLKLGVAMLLLMVVAKILAKMSWEELGKGAAGIGFMTLIVLALVSISKLAGNKMASVGKTILQISVAMLLLTLVAKIISKMKWTEMAKAGLGMAFLSGIITALVVATDLAKNPTKIASTLIGVAGAMAILVIVGKMIAKMKWSEMAKAAFGLGFLTTIVAGLIVATNFAFNPNKVASTLMGVAGAMAILTVVGKLIATMKWSEMFKAAIGLTGLVGIVSLLIMITNMVKDPVKVGTTLLAMSAAIGILAGVAILIGFIDIKQLAKGVIAVGYLGAIVGLMLKCTSSAKNNWESLLAMAAAIGVMAIAVAGLSFIDPKKLKNATMALSAVMAMFSVMVMSTFLAKKCMSQLIVMTVIVGILAKVLHDVSKLPAKQTLAAATALSEVLLALSAAIAILSVAKKVSLSALLAIGVMTLVTYAMAGIIKMLKDMPVEKTLGIVDALSKLITVLTIVCAALTLIGLSQGAPLLGVAYLAGVVAGLGGLFIGIGALMQNVKGLEGKLDKGIAIVEKIAYGLGSAIGSLIGGLSAGITSGLPAIANNLSEFMENAQGFIKGAENIKPGAMDSVVDLAKAMLVITATDIVDQLVEFFGGSSAISDFGDKIVLFGEALSSFSDTISGKIDTSTVKAAADSGKMLAEMAAALPRVGGLHEFFNGVTDWHTFNNQMLNFGWAITSFSDIVKGKIDTEAVETAANAGKVMAEMADTLPKTLGVMPFFTGEVDWHGFNTGIISFAGSITAFSNIVKGKIDTEAVTTASNAGKVMAEMADKLPKTLGVCQFFTGEVDWHGFGNGIISFAGSIVSFSNVVKGKIDSESVTAAANAGKALASMADTIPNTGGVVDFFAGQPDWHGFNVGIIGFGGAIATFAQSLQGVTVDESMITTAAKAGTLLASMADTLPKTGGVVEFFVGKPNWDDFNTGIEGYGAAISAFAGQLTDITVDETMISTAAKAGTMLASMAATIPKEGGLWGKLKEWFVGETGWNEFGEGIKGFGKAIKGFSDELKDLGSAEDLSAKVETAGDIIYLASDIFEDVLTDIFFDENINWDGLASNLKQLGGAVNSFFTSFPDISGDEATRKAVSAKVVLGILKDMPSYLTSTNKVDLTTAGTHLVNFGKSVEAFINQMSGINYDGAEDSMKQFVSTFESMVNSGLTTISDHQDEYNTAGKTLVEEFMAGFESKKSNLKFSIGLLVTAAMSGADIEGEYTKWKSAGQYLVEGFASGITADTYKATAASAAMAEAAISAAREKLKINSPSKVFYALGSGVIEGFVGAVDDGNTTVYKSGSGLADTVRNGFTKAVRKVQEIFDNGIDARPTIRPVLDLSDVESGVGSINGMFDSSPSIGLMSNIRAISSSMNSRQNGGNADVVSAIKDLKGTLSKLPGNNYSVNGISYNDESMVSDAIETLVQATRIDRRR